MLDIWRRWAISRVASDAVPAAARNESVTPRLLDPFAIGQVGVPCVALTSNEPDFPHPRGHFRLTDHRALDNQLHG